MEVWWTPTFPMARKHIVTLLATKMVVIKVTLVLLGNIEKGKIFENLEKN